MTIAALPPPPPHIPDSDRQLPPGRHDGEGARGFSALLAEMLVHRSNALAKGVAAAITPSIGQSANAFDEAPLLVRTAVEFLSSNIPAPTGEINSPVSWPTVTTQADSLRSQTAPHLQISSTEFYRSSGSSHVIELRAATSPALRPLPAPRFASIRSAQEVPASNIVASFTATEDAASTAPAIEGAGADSRHISGETRGARFAAQLLAIEDGLRLILRLPKLIEGERRELETRLARLMEDFGHRRHELVIHEIEKG